MTRKPYPDDLTDKEWNQIELIFKERVYRGVGTRYKYSRREMLNVIFSVLRTEGKDFIVEARRWIVERTFAWLGKFRRLSKDYELISTTSVSMIYLVMTQLMLRIISALI